MLGFWKQRREVRNLGTSNLQMVSQQSVCMIQHNLDPVLPQSLYGLRFQTCCSRYTTNFRYELKPRYSKKYLASIQG